MALSDYLLLLIAGKVLSFCTAIDFTLDRKVADEDTGPCKPSYVDGYPPPGLLTKTGQMTF